MDACYAMYKTLFRMAYPFSYDLGDLADYWLAYDRLMAHWRERLPPGRMLEIDYEDLAADQAGCPRRLPDHAGLESDPACRAFDPHPSPSLTASAPQATQPSSPSSHALWSRYPEPHTPL